jgi:hypothetical protein
MAVLTFHNRRRSHGYIGSVGCGQYPIQIKDG